MKVLYRVKDNGDISGYIMQENNQSFFVPIFDTYLYFPENAKRIKNGEYIALKGNNIKSIDSSKLNCIQINSRNTSIIGKPSLILNSSFGKLSKTQIWLLNQFKDSYILTINKKMSNLKVTMKDLSCLTAYTGLEYALFDRNDKYIIVQGTERGMTLSQSFSSELINKRYKWIGHTHPGNTFNSLLASDQDYSTLKLFNQRQSVIYNSIGQWYTFGEG